MSLRLTLPLHRVRRLLSFKVSHFYCRRAGVRTTPGQPPDISVWVTTKYGTLTQTSMAKARASGESKVPARGLQDRQHMCLVRSQLLISSLIVRTVERNTSCLGRTYLCLSLVLIKCQVSATILKVLLAASLPSPPQLFTATCQYCCRFARIYCIRQRTTTDKPGHVLQPSLQQSVGFDQKIRPQRMPAMLQGICKGYWVH